MKKQKKQKQTEHNKWALRSKDGKSAFIHLFCFHSFVFLFSSEVYLDFWQVKGQLSETVVWQTDRTYVPFIRSRDNKQCKSQCK